MGNQQSESNPTPAPDKNDPKAVVRAWKSQIRTAQRQIDRQMREIERAQEKTKNEIKKLVQAGQPDSAKILAKEVVHSRAALDRLYTSKTHLSSIISELDHQVALLRTTKIIQNCNGILKDMNEAVKASEISGVCASLYSTTNSTFLDSA